MKEIGSEFWEVPICGQDNHYFNKNIQWYASGRSALQAIIKDLQWAKTVAMPTYCCESMIKPFWDAGISVQFYSVYSQDGLMQEIQNNSDVLFVMDYFGYSNDDIVLNHPCIIRDTTHSIFTKDYTDADYYFGSLRKWCGFWTGGYAWAKDGHRLIEGDVDDKYILLRQRAMSEKKYCIESFSDKESIPIREKKYLETFKEAEERLDKIGIMSASKRDIEFAHKLDIDFIKKQRRLNAKILIDNLSEYLIFPELKDLDCPLFVPIFLEKEKRNSLRLYLIEKNIYCTFHWPVSRYHRLTEKDRMLYESELSLICDQRYTEEDMLNIVRVIKKFFEEND